MIKNGRIKATALLCLLLVSSLFSCTASNSEISSFASSCEVSRGVSEFSAEVSDTSALPQAEGQLKVHFIDVGQGDSCFIQLPNGTNMLIDAGDALHGETVISYIKALGCTRLDYLVATHPHADHIGGMTAVVNALDIGAVYMPDCDASTETYLDLLTAIDAKGMKIKKAAAGITIANGNGFSMYFVAPNGAKYTDLNNYSAVVYLKYGEKAFLFMGDAEYEAESEITTDISCDVIKVGHHGSDSSSFSGFLTRAGADIAVISCGKGNSYGHPHAEVLERLVKSGVSQILRTDLLGTIVITSDGKSITADNKIDTGTDNSAAQTHLWILNTNTKKIHYPSCSSVDRISDANRAESTKTVAELLSQGYTVCGICKPKD